MSPAGRPGIGPPINIRLGGELLSAVDDYAETEGVTRAGALRTLVQGGLSNQLAHIREFCNAVPERGGKWDAYELACEIRDFIDGDTDRLPL